MNPIGQRVTSLKADPSGVISWDELETVLTVKEYNELRNWLRGQTGGVNGPFSWDIMRWIQGLPVID